MTCRSIFAAASLAVSSVASAQVPTFQTDYTADPAPTVHDDVVYLFTGHDEDETTEARFVMYDYLLFSSTDMVNWTHHGPALNVGDVFAWSNGEAMAAQCIERDGKWYFYVSTGHTTSPGIAIGVAVADRPEGPYTDAIGEALVTNNMTTQAKHGWDDLDPSVFIDDDGRAFMYWGNNACYFAELGDDMISLKSDITALSLDEETFGPDFEEAPWVYQRGEHYYLVYASGLPESIHYAMSDSPTGPWKYAGEVMDIQETTPANHPGIFEFKGQPYLATQTDALPGSHGKRRAVAIEPFEYNEDGTIPYIPWNDGVVESQGTINPREPVQGETLAWAQGVEVETLDSGERVVDDFDHADYVVIRAVDFGDRSPGEFVASLRSVTDKGTIDIRTGSVHGRLIGQVELGVTDGFEEVTTRLRETTGVHDVYLLYAGLEDDALALDWWMVR